jgi:murein DD-endopeptidase MepM/ murein hydrolase activator NlpD
MDKQIATFILVLLLSFSAIPVAAQTATPPPGPIYIVQKGDTLWDIASRFNASVNAIQAINNMETQDIFVGDKLIIPGLEGLTGTLVTKAVPFGETLQSLSRQYRVDPATLRKLNHIVSPTELYVGYELVILQQDDQPAWKARASLGHGETMLELAAKGESDPWTIAEINGLAQIKIVTSQAVTLGGVLVDQPLHFFNADANTHVALQGIHAMLDPGIYPLRLDMTREDGSFQSFEQMVLVKSGNFPNDPALDVDPSTIDPAVTGPEEKWLLSLTSVITPDKYWNGVFQLPVDSEYCVRSWYGDRRSYNNGALHTFHTGIDYGVCSQAHPFDIYAAADGVVVYTGLKTVRGNATIIDHGQGIFSAYYHQAEIKTAIGEHVTAGDLIGKIGDTGRVTGAHLHFEIWVNGIQVDPLPWFDQPFPH